MLLKCKIVLAIFLLVYVVPSSFALQNDSTKLTLLTGNVNWNYHKAGIKLCQHLNALQMNFHCEAIPSKGSTFNIHQLQQGKCDFAFAQSDIVKQFITKQKKPIHFRTIINMHTEYYYVAVHEKSNIYNLSQLRDKSINIGPIGSGLFATNQIVLTAAHLKEENFKKVFYLPAVAQVEPFCKREIDAITFILDDSSEGTQLLYSALQKCNMRILNLSDEIVNHLLGMNLDYKKALVYLRNASKPTRTISLSMLLLANKESYQKSASLLNLYVHKK